MNQNQAPIGTVATLGHPANRILIAKGDRGWVYLHDGSLVDDEDFRAGWDFYTPNCGEIGEKIDGRPACDKPMRHDGQHHAAWATGFAHWDERSAFVVQNDAADELLSARAIRDAWSGGDQ